MSERMSSTSDTGNIMCPYFKAHNSVGIKCRGVVPDSSTITQFKTPEDKRLQQKCFCELEYKRCEIYRSIEHFEWTDDDY